jgi:uncharacterized protein YkwD
VIYKLRFISTTCLLLFVFGCSSSDINPIAALQSKPSEAQVEMASFDLINQDRKDHGLPQLQLDSTVANVARAHSADMRDRNYYSHTSPDGTTFSVRLKNGGVSFRAAGENLARMSNISDPASFANSELLKDSGHRSNLLSNRYTHVGVGVARSGDTYWITQDFIAR